MRGSGIDLYSISQIIDLLGGKRSNLPTWLEWRGNEIWWASRFDDDDDLTDAERAAVRAHPNDEAETAPLLREHFTEAEFIAFEDCAHVFRSRYLTGPVEVIRSTDGETRHRVVRKWTALKADAAEPIRQSHPRAYALLEALLGVPRGPRRRAIAATPREDAILDVLRALGVDPLQLPIPAGRTPGPKAKCWGVLERSVHLFASRGQFDDAWESLRSQGRIGDAGRPRPADSL